MAFQAEWKRKRKERRRIAMYALRVRNGYTAMPNGSTTLSLFFILMALRDFLLFFDLGGLPLSFVCLPSCHFLWRAQLHYQSG